RASTCCATASSARWPAPAWTSASSTILLATRRRSSAGATATWPRTSRRGRLPACSGENPEDVCQEKELGQKQKGVSGSPAHREQPLPLDALELLVADHPALVSAPTAALPRRPDAPQPAPLAHGVLALAEGLAYLLAGVPGLRRLALQQGGQRGLDLIQADHQ